MKSDSNKETSIKIPLSKLDITIGEYQSTNTNNFENKEKFAKVKNLNSSEIDKSTISTKDKNQLPKNTSLEASSYGYNQLNEKMPVTQTSNQNEDLVNIGQYSFNEKTEKANTNQVNKEGLNTQINSSNNTLVLNSPFTKDDLKNWGAYLNKILDVNNLVDSYNTYNVTTNMETKQNNNIGSTFPVNGETNIKETNKNVQPNNTVESRGLVNDYSNYNFDNQKSEYTSNFQLPTTNYLSTYNQTEETISKTGTVSTDNAINNNKQVSQQTMNNSPQLPLTEYQSTNIKNEKMEPTTEEKKGETNEENPMINNNNQLMDNDSSLNQYLTNYVNENAKLTVRKENGETIVEYPPVEINNLSGYATNIKTDIPFNTYTTINTNISSHNNQPSFRIENEDKKLENAQDKINNLPDNTTNIKVDVPLNTYVTNTNFSNQNNRPSISSQNGETIIKYPSVEINNLSDNKTNIKTDITLTTYTEINNNINNKSNQPSIRSENGETIIKYPPVEINNLPENTKIKIDIPLTKYTKTNNIKENILSSNQNDNKETKIKYPPVEINNLSEYTTNIKTDIPLNTYTTINTNISDKNNQPSIEANNLSEYTTNIKTDIPLSEYITANTNNKNIKPTIRTENGETIVEYPPVEINNLSEYTTNIKTDIPLTTYTTTNTNINNKITQPSISSQNKETFHNYPPVEMNNISEYTTNIKTDIPLTTTYTTTNINTNNKNAQPSIRTENGETIVEYPPVEINNLSENITNINTDIPLTTNTMTTNNNILKPKNVVKNLKPLTNYLKKNILNQIQATGINENKITLTDNQVTNLDKNTDKQTTPAQAGFTTIELPKANIVTQEVQSVQNFKNKILPFENSKTANYDYSIEVNKNETQVPSEPNIPTNTNILLPTKTIPEKITQKIKSFENSLPNVELSKSYSIPISTLELSQSSNIQNIFSAKDNLPQIPTTTTYETQFPNTEILNTYPVVNNPTPTITQPPITVTENKNEYQTISLPLETHPTLPKTSYESIAQNTINNLTSTLTQNQTITNIDNTLGTNLQNIGLTGPYTVVSNPIPTLTQNQTTTTINNEYEPNLQNLGLTEPYSVASNSMPTLTQNATINPIIKNPILHTTIRKPIITYKNQTYNEDFSKLSQPTSTSMEYTSQPAISSNTVPYNSQDQNVTIFKSYEYNNNINTLSNETNILPETKIGNITSYTHNYSLNSNPIYTQYNIPPEARTQTEYVPVEEIEYVPVKKLKFQKRTKVIIPKIKQVIVPVKKTIYIKRPPQKIYIPMSSTTVLPTQYTTNINYSESQGPTSTLPYNSQSALTEYENEIEEANQFSNVNYNVFSNPQVEETQSPLNIPTTNISSNANYNIFSNPQVERPQSPLNVQTTNTSSNANYNIFSNPQVERPQSPLNVPSTNISSNANYNIFSNPQNERPQSPLNVPNTNIYNNNMNQNIPMSPMRSSFSGKLYEPRTYRARSLVNRKLLI